MTPKTMFERAWERFQAGDPDPYKGLPQAPHCDSRILHVPVECTYCAQATDLQREREELGISNTGHMNREHPCPADVARTPEQYNAWPGNQAKP